MKKYTEKFQNKLRFLAFLECGVTGRYPPVEIFWQSLFVFGETRPVEKTEKNVRSLSFIIKISTNLQTFNFYEKLERNEKIVPTVKEKN